MINETNEHSSTTFIKEDKMTTQIDKTIIYAVIVALNGYSESNPDGPWCRGGTSEKNAIYASLDKVPDGIIERLVGFIVDAGVTKLPKGYSKDNAGCFMNIDDVPAFLDCIA